jgi:hypothetical protein
MAYAVFKDEEKISRTFPTREPALKKADEAGLVDSGNGEPTLDTLDQAKREKLLAIFADAKAPKVIKPCAPDVDSKSDDDLDWAMEQDRSFDHRTQDSHSGSTEGESS